MSFKHADYYNTLVHETGHFLGLGHRQPFTIEGMLGVLQENDIMFFASNSFHKITKVDIDALVYYYGKDGFENPETVFIPSNYTIPH